MFVFPFSIVHRNAIATAVWHDISIFNSLPASRLFICVGFRLREGWGGKEVGEGAKRFRRRKEGRGGGTESLPERAHFR